MFLRNFSSFPESKQLFLLVAVTFAKINILILPVSSKAYESDKNFERDLFQNTIYTNTSQNFNFLKACVRAKENCRSAADCCKNSNGGQLTCAIGNGTQRTCQKCNEDNAPCLNDPTICCEGYVCATQQDNTAVCKSCSTEDNECTSDLPCCKGNKCVGDVDGGVCKRCHDLNESCNPELCCGSLACQIIDGFFNCGPCSLNGDYCMPGESPEPCCYGNKCYSKSNTCKPCNSPGTSCVTNQDDQEDNCCPGSYCISDPTTTQLKCGCLKKGHACNPDQANHCCAGIPCDHKSKQCCLPKDRHCNPKEDSCCNKLKCDPRYLFCRPEICLDVDNDGGPFPSICLPSYLLNKS